MSAVPPHIMTFEEFEAHALSLMRPAFKSRYGMIGFADLDQPGEQVEWLVDDLLTSGDKSIIAGPSGSGKSFIAIDLGLAIAQGKEFFGKPTRQGLVLYQAGEGARGIKNRLKAYRDYHKLGPDFDPPFRLLTKRVDLFNGATGDVDGIIEEINAAKALFPVPLRAVFFDTLAKVQGAADENNGKDVAQLLDHIDRVQRETGAHICLVHHLNAAGSKIRGHSSLYANLDEVLLVSRNEENGVRTLATDKVKDGEDDIKIHFELKQVKLGQDDRGKEVTSCVCLPVGMKDLANAEAAPGIKGENVTKGAVLWLQTFFKGLDEFGEPPPEGLSLAPSATKVVDDIALRKLYYGSQMIEHEDPKRERERVSKQYKRAGDELIAKGVIALQDRKIWHTGKPVHGVPSSWREAFKERDRARRKIEAAAMRDEAAMGGPDDDLPFA